MIENFFLKALIAIAASATVSGMLSKEPLQARIKNFIAGICGGAVVILIATETQASHLVILISSNVMTGFVTVLWPMMGEAAARLIKKKTNDII